jgi:CheY-like chemotaxis protein
MPPNPTRILFVDDEPSIRMMLPPVLQQQGFEVRALAPCLRRWPKSIPMISTF